MRKSIFHGVLEYIQRAVELEWFVHDINVELAIPTSIVGESFLISAIAEAKRTIVPFKIPAGKFWVELMCVVNG